MSASKEVYDAIGTTAEDAEIERLGAGLAQQSALEQKAQRLGQLKADRVARRLDKRLAQLTAVAERRRVGIKKEVGRIAEHELDRDAARFIAAVAAVVAAAQTCN